MFWSRFVPGIVIVTRASYQSSTALAVQVFLQKHGAKIKTFHGVEPNRGAVFVVFAEPYGVVCCLFYVLRIVRCGAVRCGAVRCGFWFLIFIRFSAVQNSAVRCGAVRCGNRYLWQSMGVVRLQI